MTRIAIALLLALSIPALPALADKPDWAGKGKGHDHGDDDDQGDQGEREHGGRHFSKRDREIVHTYYVTEYRGACPPGLAKKHNGCLPPGIAKKRYVVGHALPSGIVLAPLPVELSVRLGPPPVGFAYGVVDGDVVRVAELAAGSFMVVDAINGLMH